MNVVGWPCQLIVVEHYVQAQKYLSIVILYISEL